MALCDEQVSVALWDKQVPPVPQAPPGVWGPV